MTDVPSYDWCYGLSLMPPNVTEHSDEHYRTFFLLCAHHLPDIRPYSYTPSTRHSAPSAPHETTICPTSDPTPTRHLRTMRQYIRQYFRQYSIKKYKIYSFLHNAPHSSPHYAHIKGRVVGASRKATLLPCFPTLLHTNDAILYTPPEHEHLAIICGFDLFPTTSSAAYTLHFVSM